MIHGAGKKLSWDDLRNYDVVLTTYGTLGAEYKRLEKFLDQRRGQEYDEAPMRKSFPLLGPRSIFYRVLLDEAQCIKNKASLAARAACHINAKYRFCLTGTPMMNNVGELYSLIRFLRIKPYNEWSRFSSEFGMLSTGTRKSYMDPAKAMRKFQTLLKAIMLRRTKTSLIDGKPIITLPPKTEEIQHVVFDDDEKAFYNALEQKTQVQFNKYLKAGTVTKNYSNILVLLLRLRQACCHPHLIQDFEQSPVAGSVDIEGMMDLARSLAPDVVARLLAAGDAFECPVCYDGVPNPKIVVPCGHDTCSECLTKIADSAVQQNVAEGQEGATNGRCPTCRGNLVMSKVIDYSTFKKVHKPEEGAEEDVTASENSDESEAESESENEDEEESEDDANSDGDLRNFIVPDNIDDESTEGEDGDDEAEEEPHNSRGKGKAVAKSKSKPKNKAKSKSREKDRKGKKKEKNTHVSIAMLKQQANKSKEGRRRYMRYLKKNWQPSAKITKCVELLGQFREEGEKTIIFSQFVSLLDLVQVPINEKQWKCLRYDGSMSADERNDAIVSFTDSRDYNIMLISLKAGNAGLNLVAASRVIILDPFWNPYIEMQAVDRAHRIGQQKEVQVHRILIETTVEDRIIALQEKKRNLVESALDEGANREVGRLDVRQLAFLFGVAA
jgi:SNF2 family DNA or RNA helicase